MVFTGRIGSKLKMEGFLDLPIRIDVGLNGNLWRESLSRLFAMLPGLDIDIGNLGTLEQQAAATMLTRENLEQTLDILGINADRPISAVAADVKKIIESSSFPEGYSAKMSGTPANMAEANERRGLALKRGFIFLYLVLLLLFETWWHPILVMATIPLSLIWGFWGLVIFDKPMCLPALNGFILLGGTIVNNAIILIDFIEQARLRGLDKRQALFDSVRIRLRPIFITTFSTVLGLLPLTFEQAVGLERLSPLGVVATCGLTGGTLMTLVIIPVLYDFVTDWGTWLKGLFGVSTAGKTSAKAVVILVALLIHGTGFAQETIASDASPVSNSSFNATPSGQILSVRECLDLAQKQSPILAALETERIGAVGVREEVAANGKPQIDSAGAYRQWDRKRVGMLGIAPTERQFYDRNLSEFRLTLRQLLWDGNQTRNRKEAANQNIKSKEAQLERARQEVAAEVLINSLGVFTAEALLKAAEKTLVDIQTTLQKMEAMEAVGRVPHVDVLRIQARVQEVLETQESFRQSRANFLARLSSVVGCDEPIQGLTEEGLPSLATETANDTEQLVHKALQQRADLKGLRLTVNSMKQSARAQRNGKDPQFFLNTTVNRYGDGTGWGREIGFVGVEFQWMLEDGGRNRGKVRQAMAQTDAALARLRQAELKTAEQVRTAIANLNSARVRLERNQANLKYAEEAFRIEQVKYEQGKGTINDVLDAESAMFQAEGQVIRSRNEVLAAQIALELASH